MRALVVGGAGFIGIHAARRLIQAGHPVLILDNLSRPGSERNLEWLRQFGRYEFVQGDIRDYAALEDLFRNYRGIEFVLHLAGQVAMTTSISDPRLDFESNALGAFNLLEAIRHLGEDPIVLFSSTNKVYGGMETVAVEEAETRYRYRDLPFGADESVPLDFHSPYGCSKGAADQYVRDYARIFGLRTIVFRQSCIYGTQQFGIEDQGWVAWFVIACVLGKPLTLYGNGKQVRDVLFADDLVDAYLAAAERIDRTCGQVYNVGGGPANSSSLLELVGQLESILDRRIDLGFGPARAGDQPVFVADIRKLERDTGWKPKTSIRDGLVQLVEWVRASRGDIEAVLAEADRAKSLYDKFKAEQA